MSESKIKNFGGGLASLLLVFMMMASVSVLRDGRLLGRDLRSGESEDAEIEALTEGEDGTVSVNTTELCGDVSGYGGPVPVVVTFRKDTVAGVTILENSETPAFQKRVIKAGLQNAWSGKSAADAEQIEPDAVTGATYTSKALIANVKEAIAYYNHHETVPVTPSEEGGPVMWVGLAVVLAAAFLPMILHGSVYRTVQQLLNVGVLGFWAGTFVNYTMMTHYMSAGLTLGAAAVPVAMLIVAFIFPLFGRKGHYCAWVCPLGSLQDLASRCNPHYRLRIGPMTVKVLTTVRMLLWGALMLCLWTGLWVSWIDYELFSAFVVETAATGMLVAGGAVVLLSIVIPRPYCRFVCPTGVLLRMSQNISNK